MHDLWKLGAQLLVLPRWFNCTIEKNIVAAGPSNSTTVSRKNKSRKEASQAAGATNAAPTAASTSAAVSRKRKNRKEASETAGASTS